MKKKIMMKRTIIERMTAVLLVCTLLAGALTGCSTAKSGEEKEKKTEKGRYVEQEITLPEGVERVVGMVQKEKHLTLYSYASEDKSYQSYTYENGSWSEPEAEEWLRNSDGEDVREIYKMSLGLDGNLYALTADIKEEGNSAFRILKKMEDGTAQDVMPEAFLRENEQVGIMSMVILKDGTIGIGTYDGAAEFYKEGKNTASIETMFPESPDSCLMEAGGDTVGVIGADGNVIAFYDAETLEKTSEVAVEQKLEDTILVFGGDGIWYLVNQKGIHRIHEEGSVVETIMDSAGKLMSSEMQWFLRTFLMGENEQFYGLYSGESGYKLMEYVFDKEASAVQEETLYIYGLQENRTVALAVHAFQNSHPDVKVEYNTAVGEEESATSDHIRTLNTELLSGSGADVLILDGLPIASYMEKGVLADISDLVKTLEQSGVMTDVIGNTAVRDGKSYGLPARIGVPVIYGSEPEVKACESIESLKDYAQNHPTQSLFGWYPDYELIGMTLFHLFYEELQSDDGSLDEEQMTELLTVWKELCENGKAEVETDLEGNLWNLLNKSFCSSQTTLGEERFVNLIDLENLRSAGESYLSAGKAGGMLSGIGGYYTPKTIAGVNASSKQQDLAAEFIKCLFSEEVQKTDCYDGFSVLESEIDGMPDFVDSPEAQKGLGGYMTTNPETGEEVMVEVTYPTREETESLVAIIKGLTTPFLEDRIVSETVLDELRNCYTGKSSPEKAAKSICQKVDTYLAE